MNRYFLRPLSLALPASLSVAIGLAACEGCRSTEPSRPDQALSPLAEHGPAPTLRLYLSSSVAGALEPCGCSKDQLGGVDRFASLVEKQRGHAPASLVLAAGPLFFLDAQPRGDHATQDDWKAEAIAGAFARVGLAAWAPGANDWCSGPGLLDKLRSEAKASLVAANLGGEGAHDPAPFVVREAGGVKLGIVGISTPTRMGLAPAGVTVAPPEAAARDALAKAKAQGAQVAVLLAAMPRGEALRLAERLPEFSLVLVGKPFDQGDGNDKPAPPVLLGPTLVVETANHLQSVAVVDLFVRDGSFAFQDGSGIGRAAERDALAGRITDLRHRLDDWEKTPTVGKADLEARRADLAKLEAERRTLDAPPTPPRGSFFRYASAEIKDDLGHDAAVAQTMREYYKKVNDHNKIAFADRAPAPPGPDGQRYVGIEVCSSCHQPARQVWDATAHAHAYKTLSDQFKEYNLDCVSCHVTGYGQPGGASVTVNAGLRDVQCEDCHGPGGRHVAAAGDPKLIVGHPDPQTCVTGCHHPPHVESFDAVAHLPAILGPGHGRK